MKLELKFNPAIVLPILRVAQPYIVGIALISVFAYTAYSVNSALSVTPIPVAEKPIGISFDKKTLDSLSTLVGVPATIAQTQVGKSDPFGNN
jgi:hypothetical protein